MITHPTPAELVRAVSKWIEDVRPQLAQKDAYLARVAVNALAIVDRELSQQVNLEAESSRELEQLLGEQGDYQSLTRRLCERLESNRMTVATPGLLSALRKDTLAKLSIDQPTYRHDASSGD